jgi:hypothetical protein
MMKKVAAYLMLGLAVLCATAKPTIAQDLTAQTQVNFDSLPVNTIVTTQYAGVKFSGVDFNGSVGPNSYDYNIRVTNSTYRSYPNSVVSANSYNSIGPVYASFPIPVNNLSFYVKGIYDHIFGAGYINIYQNGNYYGYIYFTGDGNPNDPILINLSSIPDITAIYIYNYGYYPLYYDDFSFTPDLDVNITSGRISGTISGTAQNALLGGDVTLQANIVPSNRTGGTYSWSVTGPNQQVSATNTSSSYTVRWTDTGSYQAKVTYTLSGVTVSALVNVNVVAPTLDSYTAHQEGSGVSTRCAQSVLGERSQYDLGCTDLGFAGITFSSTVHIPPGPYLSDPAQSGIKYVQRVSAFRKQLNGGLTKCRTRRSSEGDHNSGWLLDQTDPYDSRPGKVRHFDEGSSLTITTDDSPGEVLEGPAMQGVPTMPPGVNDNHTDDAFKIDDYFEMYVVYFTTTTPSIKRTLGKLPWNWGGEGVYDANFHVQFRPTTMFGVQGDMSGFASSQDVSYQGNDNDPNFVMDTCPGSAPQTLNLIDSTRFFVWQQYSDVLSRAPDGAWLFWVTALTNCGFDQSCLNSLRIAVFRGFYESAEYRQNHSGFEDPNSPTYNEQYVQQLYWVTLRRPPDGAWTAWLNYLNSTGDYNGVVGGFINSIEYRNRFWP